MHTSKSVRRLPDILIAPALRFHDEPAVIGREAVDGAIEHVGPELLDLLAIANCRGAFRKALEPDQILMVHREVLRAGLGGDSQPLAFGFAHKLGGGRRAEVDDMHPAPRLLGEENRAVDGLGFDDRRSRIVVGERIRSAILDHATQS